MWALPSARNLYAKRPLAHLLVSRNGQRINESQAAHVRIRTAQSTARLTSRIDEVVQRHLDGLPALQLERVDGTIAVDRWPLRD